MLRESLFGIFEASWGVGRPFPACWYPRSPDRSVLVARGSKLL